VTSIAGDTSAWPGSNQSETIDKRKVKQRTIRKEALTANSLFCKGLAEIC
jgi:hypothetical protein